MARRFHSKRNESGSMLAAVFIITLGVGGCLFVVSAMSPESFVSAAWVLGGVLAAFLALTFWFRFGKTQNSSFGFLLSSTRNRRDDGVQDYEPRIAGQSQLSAVTGTNQPITAQEVHEIRVTSANTWVPAKSGRGKKKSQK